METAGEPLAATTTAAREREIAFLFLAQRRLPQWRGTLVTALFPEPLQLTLQRRDPMNAHSGQIIAGIGEAAPEELEFVGDPRNLFH
jgi:hypothetical protein